MDRSCIHEMFTCLKDKIYSCRVECGKVWVVPWLSLGGGKLAGYLTQLSERISGDTPKGKGYGRGIGRSDLFTSLWAHSQRNPLSNRYLSYPSYVMSEIHICFIPKSYSRECFDPLHIHHDLAFWSFHTVCFSL